MSKERHRKKNRRKKEKRRRVIWNNLRNKLWCSALDYIENMIKSMKAKQLKLYSVHVVLWFFDSLILSFAHCFKVVSSWLVFIFFVDAHNWALKTTKQFSACFWFLTYLIVVSLVLLFRSWMEAIDGRWKAAVHRRSQETSRDAYEGTSRLQVSSPSEAKGIETWRVSISNALSICARRRFKSWWVWAWIGLEADQMSRWIRKKLTTHLNLAHGGIRTPDLLFSSKF